MEILTFSLVTYGRVTEFWDGLTYVFDFKCLPKEKRGKPDLKSATKTYHLVVRISGTLSSLWNLTNDDLVKVLYYYSQEALKDKPYEMEQKIDLHTGNTPSKCPYDPEAIKFPEPFPFDIEITRRIGF